MKTRKILAGAIVMTLGLGTALTAQVRQQPGQQQQQQQQQRQQQNPQMQMQQQQAPDIDVSDEELETFVEIAQEVQKMQGESESKMRGALEEEGLDVETFQTIQQAQAQGGSPEGVSEEDMKSFEAASQKMQEIQQKDQEKMMETINESDMEMQRFQEIQMAFQSDQELQQRVRSMME